MLLRMFQIYDSVNLKKNKKIKVTNTNIQEVRLVQEALSHPTERKKQIHFDVQY